MEQWKLCPTSNGEDLRKIDFKRGIFWGDNQILRKVKTKVLIGPKIKTE